MRVRKVHKAEAESKSPVADSFFTNPYRWSICGVEFSHLATRLADVERTDNNAQVNCGNCLKLIARGKG